ncbi:MAG TPA: hypothetical protein VLY20_07320 [Nitrospiria bacterium]|nr:hypothetical protein [Nitrospiria bacterium]
MEIHVGQIALVDGKGHARLGPSFVNHASRVFIRPPEKRTLEDQLAAFPALNAFAPPVLDHLFDIMRFDGAKKKPADFVAQSG